MNVNLDPIYSMSGASLGKKKDASQWGNVEGSQLVFSFETLRKHFQVLSSPIAHVLTVAVSHHPPTASPAPTPHKEHVI